MAINKKNLWEIVNNAVFQLSKATNNAVNYLTGIMNDADAPASARVAAAREVLTQALKAIEIDELEQRLVALEQAQQQINGNGRANQW
jgi:hypothetical protein